ncbi:retrotransposon gag domain, retroviral aspartyl protease [Tanacetum coccineum]
MVIDKSWTRLGRHEKAFYTGLKKFVEDCKPLVDSVGNIKCPCKSCRLVLWVSIENLSRHITNYGFDPSYKTWIHHDEPDLPPPPPVIDNTRQPQMSDMTTCLNDLSYITLNNEQNEPTQGDIGKTSNEPTQAKRIEFEELYANANEELYPGCNYVTRLDFMAKFTYFKEDSNTPGKKVPKKVLRYFSIIPRLQRLYKSSHTAKEMTWHATRKCTEPGKMQHPIDGRAWKNFDTKYPNFVKEPRNVRLGLAADGFNLLGNLSQSYSMWPMILTTCNLPPWLCMKESSFMLTLLIPGPKSPGKDIDVYLRPLIDGLKDLWANPGVETINVVIGQKFNMRAMVLWTINDFLARSSLPGWSGQGYKACPTCNKDTLSVCVLGKTTYVGHIRFLKKTHKWRRSLQFNGETKDGDPPREFDRDQTQAQLARLPTRMKGKHSSYGDVKIKRNVLVELNWTKRSIFYELEYWLGIQSGLWLGQNKNGKCSKPQAANSFTLENRKKFGQFIKGVKLTDGFGSKFKHKVTDNDTNITGLKSHDCHIMMQHLLPYGLQQYLPDMVAKPIIELCSFFKQICSATLMEVDMLKAQSKILQRHVDKDPVISASSELFTLACGPTSTPISVNSCVVNGVRFVVPIRDECRTTQNNGICSPGGKDGEISSDLTLSTSFNELDFATLHIDGQSMDVDPPPDIIDVDEDDDIIDDEDALPHDLADSGDEDLVNVDDDDDDVAVVYSNVARGHGGDGGDDNRPPFTPGKITQKPNLGGRKAGRLHTCQEIQNLGLKKIIDDKGPILIRFEWDDKKTMMPLGPVQKEAAICEQRLGSTQFDLKPHMQSQRWTDINAGSQQHFAKLYNTKHGFPLVGALGYKPQTGRVPAWRASGSDVPRTLPPADWDAQLAFWNDPRNLARAA